MSCLVRYKINTSSVYSLVINENFKTTDLLNAINRKHGKRYNYIFSNQIDSFLENGDIISEISPENSVFYLCEKNCFDLENFYDKSRFIYLCSLKDFKNESLLYSNCVTTSIYEMFLQNCRSMRYYAETSSLNPIYTSIIHSVIHGSIVDYRGLSISDFNDSQKEVFIIKSYENGSLFKLLQKTVIDDTKRMIIIYGIAAGMSYLNSIGIQNYNLCSETVLLDKNLFPKVGFFATSGYWCEQSTSAAPNLISPEKLEKVTPKTQILLFAIIMHQLLTKEANNYDYYYSNFQKKQQNLDSDSISDEFKDLIHTCSDSNPSRRPSFSQIVEYLRSECILDGTDTRLYNEYIDLIDGYSSYLEKSGKVIPFEQFVNNERGNFIKFGLHEINDDLESKII